MSLDITSSVPKSFFSYYLIDVLEELTGYKPNNETILFIYNLNTLEVIETIQFLIKFFTIKKLNYDCFETLKTVILYNELPLLESVTISLNDIFEINTTKN